MRGTSARTAQIEAAKALLDCGFGRPTQPIAADAIVAPILTEAQQQAELKERSRRANEILVRAFGPEGEGQSPCE